MKKTHLFLTILFLFISATSFSQVIETCVGYGSAGLGDGGPAVYAQLNGPYGINLDDSGNLYICDVLNERIRKVSKPNILGVGIITTIAGNGASGYSGDHGLGINAQLEGAIDVAIDHHGNVYIADQDNHCIRKVTPSDTITTIAGTGFGGYNGDGILATTAQLNNPTGVTVDRIGNVYIVDRQNHRIRKVDTSGIITTIAGTGIAGFSPDGSRADTAKMSPFSIRINSAGIITTVAGNGIGGYSGDSGLAIIAEIDPATIAIDTSGNLFIADPVNERIRKVNTAGIITTIAGNGIQGFYGDNGNPLLAELNIPEGVAVSNSGDIYIGDVGNYRVRLVTMHPEKVNSLNNKEQEINVFPNPSTGIFNFLISRNIEEQVHVSIVNVLGEKVQEFSAATNLQVQVTLNAPPGIYFLSAITEQREYKGKIIIQ